MAKTAIPLRAPAVIPAPAKTIINSQNLDRWIAELLRSPVSIDSTVSIQRGA